MQQIQPDDLDLALNTRVFLEGFAGSGKTTYATGYLRRLLDAGIAPDRILVLVPQVTLGRPYQLTAYESPVAGGMPDIQTIAGIARRAVETYWPLIGSAMGFAEPGREPTFLNIETAQYFMARLANAEISSNRFESVSVSPQRIVSQVIDNLNKAAILRFPLDDVAHRLIAAWGERHSSRPPVYEAAVDLARQFRAYCLDHNLLDFSLVVEAFSTVLRGDPRFSGHFLERYDYLIADNIEEDNPTAHDFIRWLLPFVDGALLVYDSEGGYRIFLGADAEGAYDLSGLCDVHRTMDESKFASPALIALGREFNRSLGPTMILPEAPPPSTQGSDPASVSLLPESLLPEGEGSGMRAPDPISPISAFRFEFHDYYPQMIDWTVDRIAELVQQGVEPQQITVLAPYLGDSLRFGLMHRLNAAGIPALSHRPSRALRDEPVTRALLTITRLAHPTWSAMPPAADIADMFSQVIEGLDPVRARLLASIVYRPGGATDSTGNSALLSPFEVINAEMKQRISYLAGERFEGLRQWLEQYHQSQQSQQSGGAAGSAPLDPLDHFLRRLFGEVLSQPGYGFHANLGAGRIAAQLIESVERFRQTLYPGETADWNEAGQEYLSLIDQRLFAALHVQSWRDEESNAVFLAPAFTFLMRNRFVDYQFWLDVGSLSWWERLEQPLTHPYVLRRNYPADMPWTDEMEEDAQRELLYKIVMGLTRRCRQQIFLGIAGLGEEGFEQRGPLLRVFQQILSRHQPDQADQAGQSQEVA